MLKISLLFKKLQISRTNKTRILGIKKAKFLYAHKRIGTQTYRDVFKSALVYL